LAEWQNADLDLGEIVADAVGSTSQLFKGRSVAIETDVAAGLPAVSADRDRVMKVTLILVSNAVKFSPSGSGRVRVRVDPEGNCVRVAAADNGVGIDPQHQ